MLPELVLGTRGSALARWQTEHLAGLLGGAPRLAVIETRGDVDPTPILGGRLEKGFFTVELERALHGGEVDVAVHSLKDLPTVMPPGLVLGAVLEREEPRDWLLVRRDALAPGEPLPVRPGGRVGASSLRRMALVRHFAPSLVPTPLRGNVPTRVRRLAQGDYEAIVLAAAGLKRLQVDLSAFAVFALSAEAWVPAPGQGAIAVQCRADDARVLERLQALEHRPTRQQVDAERALLAAFEAGCSSPFGAHVQGDTLRVGREDGGAWRAASASHRGPLMLAQAQALLPTLSFEAPAHVVAEPV